MAPGSGGQHYGPKSHAQTSNAPAQTTAPDRYLIFASEWHFLEEGQDTLFKKINVKLGPMDRMDRIVGWHDTEHAWKVVCHPGDAAHISKIVLDAINSIIEGEIMASLEASSEFGSDDGIAGFEEDTKMISTKVQRLTEWNEQHGYYLPDPSPALAAFPANQDGLTDDELRWVEAIRGCECKHAWVWVCEDPSFNIAPAIFRHLPELIKLSSCHFQILPQFQTVQIGAEHEMNVNLAIHKLDLIKKYYRMAKYCHLYYTEDIDKVEFAVQLLSEVKQSYFKTTLFDNLHSINYSPISTYANLHEALTIRICLYDQVKARYVLFKTSKIASIVDETTKNLPRKGWQPEFTYRSRGGSKNDPRLLKTNSDLDMEPAAEESKSKPQVHPQVSAQLEPGPKAEQMSKWLDETQTDHAPLGDGITSAGNARRHPEAPEVDEDPSFQKPEWDTYTRHKVGTLKSAEIPEKKPQTAPGLLSRTRRLGIPRAPAPPAVKIVTHAALAVPSYLDPSKQEQQPPQVTPPTAHAPRQDSSSIPPHMRTPHQPPPPHMPTSRQLPPHMRGPQQPARLAKDRKDFDLLDDDTGILGHLMKPLSPERPGFSTPRRSYSLSAITDSAPLVSFDIPPPLGYTPVPKPINLDFVDDENDPATDSVQNQPRILLDDDISVLDIPTHTAVLNVYSTPLQESQPFLLISDDTAVNSQPSTNVALLEESLQLSSEALSRIFRNTINQKAGKPKAAQKRGQFASRLELPAPPPLPKKKEVAPTIMCDPSPEFRHSLGLSFDEIMEALRGFRGPLTVQVQFGRILLRNFNHKSVYTKEHERALNEGTLSEMLGHPTVVGPKSFFTKVLTAIPQETQYMIDLKDHSGERIWDSNTNATWSVVYELHYRDLQCNTKDPDDANFVMEIDGEAFTHKVKIDQEYGTMNVHCPRRHWDFRLVAIGSEHDNGVDTKYGEFAKSIASSLFVPDGCTRENPMFFWEIDRDVRHRYYLKDVNVRAMAAFRSRDLISLLKVTEVFSLNVQSKPYPERNSVIYEARRGSNDVEPTKKLNYWFEVAITCPKLDEQLKKNENLRLGEEAAWTAESLHNFNCAESLLVPTCQMVRQMDGVGHSNDNGIDVYDLAPVPSARPCGPHPKTEVFW